MQHFNPTKTALLSVFQSLAMVTLAIAGTACAISPPAPLTSSQEAKKNQQRTQLPNAAANPNAGLPKESSKDISRQNADISPIDSHEQAPASPSPSVIDTLEQKGIASVYGNKFQGRRTASGEQFDQNALTAAHRTLKFGTWVEVLNPRNGKSVRVRINDRGPFVKGRVIDLSRAAAQRIGISGIAPVVVRQIESP